MKKILLAFFLILPITALADTCDVENVILLNTKLLAKQAKSHYQNVENLVKRNQLDADDLLIASYQLNKANELYNRAYKLYINCARRDMI